MRRWILPLAGMLIALVHATAAHAAPATPQLDSMGPLTDVTAHWQSYQPAQSFCIRPDVPQLTPGGIGPTVAGADPACKRSGFPAAQTGLVKINVTTPILCAGCRRLFIDFSKIPAANDPPAFYAHGHVYYHLASLNPTYTVDPIGHSPNTKNFTNDKLLSPNGSLQELLIGAFDLHALAYVSDTAHFVHTAIQGPYYIGPWYLNRAGRRIGGVYLDVDVFDATKLPAAQLNAINYADGFNSGRQCPSDADAFYAGCLDWFGFSASSVDPYAS